MSMSNEELQQVIEITTLAAGLTAAVAPGVAALMKRAQSDVPATIEDLRSIVAEITERSARIQKTE